MKPLRRTLLLFGVLATSSRIGTADPSKNQPDSWSQFRGPNSSGIASSDERAPVVFSPETNLLWKTALPIGHSSPCIWGDRIFLTGIRTNENKLETLCLDRMTGKVLWQQNVPAEKIETINYAFSLNNPASATPTSNGRCVIAYLGSFGFVAYDFNGTTLWQKPWPSTADMHGSGASPVLIGDLVVMDLHLAAEPRLVALRAADGEVAWSQPMLPSSRGWSTPVLWQEGGESVLGVLNPGRFSAHRLKDGAEKWWVTGLAAETCSTPVVADGKVFFYLSHRLGDNETIQTVPSFDDLLARYDANKDGRVSTDELDDQLLLVDRQFTGQGLAVGNFSLKSFLGFFTKGKTVSYDRDGWTAQAKELGDALHRIGSGEPKALAVRCGGTSDVTSTHLEWSDKKGLPQVASPLVYRDRLYFIKNDGLITCREPGTGRIVYQERIGAPGGYYASPIATGGRIYTASDRGRITVLNAGDELEVLARNDLEESITATPALVDGKIYVRTARALYAFGRSQLNRQD